MIKGRGRIGGNKPWKAARADLKEQRRRVLAFLIRNGHAIRVIEIARRLGIENIATVLDHWWFRHTPSGVWLSEDGVRELAGTQRRAYEVQA